MFFKHIKTMEEKIPEIAVLDYAIFHVSALDNSYEALICSHGIIEKFACGSLDQLAVHLPEARASPSHGSFKLQLDESIETSLWFNKFTVARFLHIVNVPDMLKVANAIEDEISQLEETRKFHIALYVKDQLQHSGGGTEDFSCLNDARLTQQVKVETASSDATKNELLRALDLRLAALKEELTAAFNRAAGATCFSNQISDLASFAQHFGATELRKSLLKFLELCPNILPIDPLMHHQTFLNDSVNIKRMETKSFLPLNEKPDVVKPATADVSPAEVAQAERESSSESVDLSDGDNASFERSRPIVRSATPRRSASPMRRIQIGRSGSRRATALTIKSLNYFQSREKAISNRDADERENGEEELQHLPKKPENNVGRMSVQDAINLFESKQKVQNSDVQKRKTSEVSISANKSVLKRWSSGMGDSFIYSTQEKESDSCHQIAHGKLDPATEEKKEDAIKEDLSNPENTPIGLSADIVGTKPLEGIIPSETVVSTEGVHSKDQSLTADWNRQKEAELNEMLMKMMRSSKPAEYSGVKVGNDVLKDTSIDQRGGFYSHYNEKRIQKLRSENAKNHATKEAQFKLTHDTLEKSKATMASTPTGSAVKSESTNLSQKPRRNSSPPVLSKKEVSKPTNTKKVSSKSSSSLQTRSSFPSGSLKKVVDTLPAKSSPVVATGSTPSRQKSQSSSSPAQPSPRTKKPLQHMKGYNSATSVQADIKPNLFGQEHKIVKVVKKNSITVTPRSPLSGEDSGTLSSKPSVQSKYTRNSSVVPLESKPFLRKGSGIISVNGPSVAKTKDARVSKSSDSLKIIENLVLPEEQGSNPSPAGSTIKVIGDDLVQPTNVVDETLAAPLDNDNDNIETAEIVDGNLTRIDTYIWNPVEPIIAENHQDEDLGISSAAWVDAENQEYSPSSNNRQHLVVSPMIVPIPSSSPRVRHSLSQMLQADSSEVEIIEWGNAENPPSLVYQKDVPKGLKRLLKFARKNKGEGNLSPSVFSEGEEESEESKVAIKRSSDAPLRKASLQAKGYGQPKSIVSESLDLGNSIKRAMEHRGVHDDLSGSEKLRNGHFLTGVTATKATRSFFSLSSFRSGKSSETKP